MTKKKNFNLAIVGLGNIGLNLYKHLIKNKKSIIEKNNVFFDINDLLAVTTCFFRLIELKTSFLAGPSAPPIS